MFLDCLAACRYVHANGCDCAERKRAGVAIGRKYERERAMLWYGVVRMRSLRGQGAVQVMRPVWYA